MKTAIFAALLLSLISGPQVHAQGVFVSPTFNATVEGTTGNGIPFASTLPRRYMQIHSDLAGLAGALNQISFRVSTPTNGQTYLGTFTYDLEAHAGFSKPYDLLSLNFNDNYSGPRTRILQRRTVNFGPQGTANPPGPAPFTAMDLPFDQPLAFAGPSSLAWEVQIYSSTVNGSFGSPDAETAVRVAGSATTTGPGCTRSGGTAAMSHLLQIHDFAGAMTIGFSLQNAPPLTPVVWAIGLSNPSLQVPGLCSLLLTDLVLQLQLGITDALGGLPVGGPGTLILPNPGQGATLFSQVHAADTGRPTGLPLVNSNGLLITFPFSNTARPIRVARLYTIDGTATGARSEFAVTGIVGYGLVTQFRY